MSENAQRMSNDGIVQSESLRAMQLASTSRNCTGLSVLSASERAIRLRPGEHTLPYLSTTTSGQLGGPRRRRVAVIP